MYCRGCRYALDGLAQPRCPECGRPFDPSDPCTWQATRRRKLTARQWTVIAGTAMGLFVLEVLSAGVAYHTLGEVLTSGIMMILVVGNSIALLTLLFRRPPITIVALLLVAIPVIAQQMHLGTRYVLLKHEATRIVQYLETVKAATGRYPADLSGYTFAHPDYKTHFRGYTPDPAEGGYVFYWHVIQPGISHWYSPSGGWGYYPD